MANIYNEPGSTNVKITLKNNVYSYLNENIGIAKICLITDQKKFGYSDLLGNLKKCLTDASGSSLTPKNCVFIADSEGSASHSTTFVYNDNKLGVNIAVPQNKAHFHEPSTGNCLIQITNTSRGSSDDNDGMTLGVVGANNVIRTTYGHPVKIQAEDIANPGTFVDLATFQDIGWPPNTILDTDLTVNVIPAKTTEAGVFLTHENNTIKTRTAAQVLDDIGAAAVNHTQAISTIDGLQTALDGKQSTIPVGTTGQFYAWDKTMKAVDWAYVANKPSSFTPSAHNHDRLIGIVDTRAVATTPSDYPKSVIPQFKDNAAIGLGASGTYSTILGIYGWSDPSGGHAHELAFSSSGIYNRSGLPGSSWGTWKRLLTTGDISTTVAPLSHTHGISDITSLQTTLDSKLDNRGVSVTSFDDIGPNTNRGITIFSSGFNKPGQPSGAAYWSGFEFRHNIVEDYRSQIAMGTTGTIPQLAIRNKTNGVWGSWQRVLTTADNPSSIGAEPAITGTANKVLSIQADGSGVKTGSISDNGNVVTTTGNIDVGGTADIRGGIRFRDKDNSAWEYIVRRNPYKPSKNIELNWIEDINAPANVQLNLNAPAGGIWSNGDHKFSDFVVGTPESTWTTPVDTLDHVSGSLIVLGAHTPDDFDIPKTCAAGRPVPDGAICLFINKSGHDVKVNSYPILNNQSKTFVFVENSWYSDDYLHMNLLTLSDGIDGYLQLYINSGQGRAMLKAINKNMYFTVETPTLPAADAIVIDRDAGSLGDGIPEVDINAVTLINEDVYINKKVYLSPSTIKAGTSQAGAGAVAGELWRNTSTGALHLGI